MILQLSIYLHTVGLHNWQASVNIFARPYVIFDIGLNVAGVRAGGSTLHHNQISLPP